MADGCALGGTSASFEVVGRHVLVDTFPARRAVKSRTGFTLFRR